MLALIQEARRSIRLETYTFDGGVLGQTFLEALSAASARGVRVRVLIDAVGSIGLADSFWATLRAAGGEVRWFNPIALRRVSYRDHRKILVVDDSLAVVGGFNIASEYYGDGVSSGWRDCGLEVMGPLGAELGGSFEAMFARADFRHRRLSRLRRGGTRRQATGQHWQLLLSGPGVGHRVLKHSLAADFSRAQAIQIASAYFLPTWRLRRELRRAARRGARVQLLLAGKSDIRISQLASRRLYHPLLRAGVEIYEYQPQVLHAKLVLADEAVYVGSANLDARSLGINYELLIRVASPELAAGGRWLFEEALTQSRRISLAEWRQARGFLEKLLERASFFLLARADLLLARWLWRHRRRP
jgi:cardiolipin synthase A/B